MLLRPSRQTYAMGLRVLKAGWWNHTHGFELAGPPRALFSSRETAAACKRSFAWRDDAWNFVCSNSDQGLFTRASEPITRHMATRIPVRSVRSAPLKATAHCRYIYAMRLPAGAFQTPETHGASLLEEPSNVTLRHTVLHLWGPSKPWTLLTEARLHTSNDARLCRKWYEHLSSPALSRRSTPCLRFQRERAASLRERESRLRVCEGWLASHPTFARKIPHGSRLGRAPANSSLELSGLDCFSVSEAHRKRWESPCRGNAQDVFSIERGSWLAQAAHRAARAVAAVAGRRAEVRRDRRPGPWQAQGRRNGGRASKSDQRMEGRRAS